VTNLPLPFPLIITSAFLLIAAVGFVIWFMIPAIKLRTVFGKVLSDLRRSKSNDPASLRAIFSQDTKLKHLWNEFAETLHSQSESTSGISKIVAVRSTQPAETYFNSQFAVDSHVRTEFFRHLPGILTGIGIIGTFTGLIGGLKQFQRGLSAGESGSGSAMSGALAGLLGEVSTAFIVSGTAIALAMAATALEKILITSLYRLIEEIAQNIDERFDAGAGEEYLARLVSASEDSATQSKILKDSLVNDLRDVLREIAERQISAGSQANIELGDRISRSISEGLAAPLDKISSSVSAASGDQSATAGRLLQDAMAGFSQQVSDLFGGQLKGIAALNSGAAENMTEVVQTLNRLVGGIEAASSRGVESINEQIADALQRMEQHQQEANAQSAAFVAQLRTLLAESQTETTGRMQTALASLGENVSTMLDSMRQGNERALAANHDREEAVANKVAVTVGSMTGSVDAAVEQIAEVSKAMNAAVTELGRITTTAIDRMNQGANTLHSATLGFAEAGKSVTGVVAQVTTVGNKFSEMSGALTSGASAMQTTIADYKTQRMAIVSLLADLTSATEIARRDIAMSQDIVSRMETSSQKLAQAQGQVSEYLDGVGDVLVEAQEKFSDATVKALDKVNQNFHKQLETAVSLLANSIQELDTTLAQVGAKS